MAFLEIQNVTLWSVFPNPVTNEDEEVVKQAEESFKQIKAKAKSTITKVRRRVC